MKRTLRIAGRAINIIGFVVKVTCTDKLEQFLGVVERGETVCHYNELELNGCEKKQVGVYLRDTLRSVTWRQCIRFAATVTHIRQVQTVYQDAQRNWRT